MCHGTVSVALYSLKCLSVTFIFYLNLFHLRFCPLEVTDFRSATLNTITTARNAAIVFTKFSLQDDVTTSAERWGGEWMRCVAVTAAETA